MSPPEAQASTLAGRKWLRSYVNGCAFQFWEVPVPQHLAGQRFIEVAAWLYWTSGYVLTGESVMSSPRVGYVITSGYVIAGGEVGFVL